TGRRLLRAAAGGLPVKLTADGMPWNGGRVLHDHVATVVFRQTKLVIPIVGPFATSKDLLTTRTNAIVRGAARTVRHAKAGVCVRFPDWRGSRAMNLGLGMRRARQVCRALRALGVRARLSSRSRGEDGPRATNLTVAGRALNRRVELHVNF